MARIYSLCAVLVSASLCAWLLPLPKLLSGAQTLTVALSIMMAAILVRLNRGMPTLDWKGLEPAGRARLTARIVEMNLEYCIILAIITATLIVLIGLVMTGAETVGRWPDQISRAVSGGVAAMLALSAVRMSYIVWRDYDVVKLQKHLIDAAGEKERVELETKSADSKIASMNAAGLRRTGQAAPKTWSE